MANDVEMKKLTLTDVNAVVESVVNVLFDKNETAGSISYLGQYDRVLRLYFEMAMAFPDLEIHKMKMPEFFEKYCDGEFDTYVEKLKTDRRIQYIEDALDNTTQNLVKYYAGGQLANSVTRLINGLNGIVEKYANSIEGVEASDIKGFFNNFVEFASKTNTETVTAAMLKKKKATPKPKKTTQTESKKIDD